MLETAGENRAEIERALALVPNGRRVAMEFLIENMPLVDLQNLKADYLLGRLPPRQRRLRPFLVNPRARARLANPLAAGVRGLWIARHDRARRQEWSSNISDKEPRQLTSAEKKRAHTITANVSKFVESYGLDACAFLTITFAKFINWREAQRRFDNWNRRELREMVRGYICVLEWQANGRPHFHLLVAFNGDVRAAFNFPHYLELCAWNKRRRQGPKPPGSLNRNALLVSLHDRINQSAPAYGLGRMELVPIRTTKEAIGYYVGGYLAKSLTHRDDADKRGARLVRYSRSAPRIIEGPFSWALSPGAWLWRQKVGAWARHHGCSNLDEVASVFGPRWAHNHRESIVSTRINHWPTYGHWVLDQGTKKLPEGICADDFPLSRTRGYDRRETSAAIWRRKEIEEALRVLEAIPIAEGVPWTFLPNSYVEMFRRWGRHAEEKRREHEELYEAQPPADTWLRKWCRAVAQTATAGKRQRCKMFPPNAGFEGAARPLSNTPQPLMENRAGYGRPIRRD